MFTTASRASSSTPSRSAPLAKHWHHQTTRALATCPSCMVTTNPARFPPIWQTKRILSSLCLRRSNRFLAYLSTQRRKVLSCRTDDLLLLLFLLFLLLAGIVGKRIVALLVDNVGKTIRSLAVLGTLEMKPLVCFRSVQMS